MHNPHRPLILWLSSCALFVFLIVGVGGATRLTQSGLSITEWKPFTGIMPPLSQAAWEQTFAAYKQSPEYKLKHYWMALSDYKKIFMWEYIHRLIARSIGLVFALPLLIFWLRGKLPSWLKKRGLLILFLGGLQGLMGWIMVSSGLVNHPFVSHIKLSLHLLLALLVFGVILWTIFELIHVYTDKSKINSIPSNTADKYRTAFNTIPVTKSTWASKYILLLTSLIVLQIAAGGLVAGLHAGRSYNTFPTMNGMWIPDNLYSLSPWISNFFNNGTTVQFNHRLLGWIIATLAICSPYILRKVAYSSVKKMAIFLVCITLLQFTLGVFTLLYSVPVVLGVIHQMTAFLLFSVSLYMLFKTKRIGKYV